MSDLGYSYGQPGNSAAFLLEENKRLKAEISELKAALAARQEGVAELRRQHLGWLKLYAEGMTVDNWRDMRDRILRQISDMHGAAQQDGVRWATIEECAKIAEAAIVGGNDEWDSGWNYACERLALQIRDLARHEQRS